MPILGHEWVVVLVAAWVLVLVPEVAVVDPLVDVPVVFARTASAANAAPATKATIARRATNAMGAFICSFTS